MALELRSFHDREKRLPGKTFRERVYIYVCVCVCVRVLGEAIMVPDVVVDIRKNVAASGE